MIGEQIMKIAFNKIATQKFNGTEQYTTKQVGDIISVVALMVADPEPRHRAILYAKLISYLNLPEELQSHMFDEILNSREALKMALSIMASENPMEAVKKMLEEDSDEED